MSTQTVLKSSSTYLARAEFHDSFVKVQSPNEPMKAISWDDFTRIYNESILGKKSEESKAATSTETCLMPMNVIATKDHFKKGDLVKKEITMFFPEMVAPLNYMSGDKKTVYNNFKWPNIIITCTLNLNQKNNLWGLGRTKFFSTDKRSDELEITGPIYEHQNSKRIWTLPLPNMHGDGSMCFGKNSIPSTYNRNDLRDLTWLYVMTTTSSFNSDLSIPGIGTGRDGIKSFLNEVNTVLKVFPYWRLPSAPWKSEEEFNKSRGLTTEPTKEKS